jgi:hypothetical protein
MSDYDCLGIEIPAGILAERRRQIDVEGWSAGSDDLRTDGALLAAAMLYYRHGAGLHVSMVEVWHRGSEAAVECPLGWPWLPEWWKPRTPRRDLERAGALCLAEIDRMRRWDSTCDVDVVLVVLKDVVKAYAALPEASDATAAP